jgi:hypothetical protein
VQHNPLHSELAEQLVDLRLVALVLLVFVGGGFEGVLAGVADLGFEPGELVAGGEAPLAAETVPHGPGAAWLGDDRDQEFARYVASDDHGVGPVELGRGEEFQPAALRRVHIGDEVNSPSGHTSVLMVVLYRCAVAAFPGVLLCFCYSRRTDVPYTGTT